MTPAELHRASMDMAIYGTCIYNPWVKERRIIPMSELLAMQKEEEVNQKLIIRNTVDELGQPCGGRVEGRGIDIRWQDGPLRKQTEKPADVFGLPTCEPSYIHALEGVPGQNGAFVEGVISAALTRLEFYQTSKFRCTENAAAIRHLKSALSALESRTARRVKDGTEGTHQGK
jgi:hypothetical protein